MHPHDEILQSTCPTVMVPRFGNLEPLVASGHRFLSASDGLWIEVKRPWLHLVWPIALQNDFAMPYGALEKKVQFSFDHIPQSLMDAFIVDATAALPNEFGAWLIWDDFDQELKYRPLHSREAGPGHLEVDRPSLEDHESLAIDLHSHGHGKALFSPIDDRDDRGEVKISGVVGKLGRDGAHTMVFRLCTGGVYIDIPAGSKL